MAALRSAEAADVESVYQTTLLVAANEVEHVSLIPKGKEESITSKSRKPRLHRIRARSAAQAFSLVALLMAVCDVAFPLMLLGPAYYSTSIYDSRFGLYSSLASIFSCLYMVTIIHFYPLKFENQPKHILMMIKVCCMIPRYLSLIMLWVFLSRLDEFNLSCVVNAKSSVCWAAAGGSSTDRPLPWAASPNRQTAWRCACRFVQTCNPR